MGEAAQSSNPAFRFLLPIYDGVSGAFLYKLRLHVQMRFARLSVLVAAATAIAQAATGQASCRQHGLLMRLLVGTGGVTSVTPGLTCAIISVISSVLVSLAVAGLQCMLVYAWEAHLRNVFASRWMLSHGKSKIKRV